MQQTQQSVDVAETEKFAQAPFKNDVAAFTGTVPSSGGMAGRQPGRDGKSLQERGERVRITPP